MIVEKRLEAGPWPRVMIPFAMLVATCVESFLFEIIRSPYNPPHDLSMYIDSGDVRLTVVVMIGIALFCLAWLIGASLLYRFQPQDYRRIGLFMVSLLIVELLVLFYPPWPVTPFSSLHW